MEKTTLILAFSGKSGISTATAAAAEALGRGRETILAIPGEAPSPLPVKKGIQHPDPNAQASPEDGLNRLYFRPGSSLQARALFLEAANAKGAISEVILCRGPASSTGPVVGVSQEDCESFSDGISRSCLQLLREAAATLGRGPSRPRRIAFIDGSCSEGRDYILSPGLAALEEAFFRGLEDAALAESGPGLEIFCISGGSDSLAPLSQALFKALDDPSGKCAGKRIRLGRGGFLSRF